jgi:hypothetical protein
VPGRDSETCAENSEWLAEGVDAIAAIRPLTGRPGARANTQVDRGQIPAEQAAVLILLCAPKTDGATTWLRAADNLHHE